MQKVLNNLRSYKDEIVQLPYANKETAFELVWLARRVAGYIYDATTVDDQFKKEAPAAIKKQAGDLAALANTSSAKALKSPFEAARGAIVQSLDQLIDQLNNTSSALSV